MGSERRIPAAECTEYPWWVIIDPCVAHGLFSKRQRVGRAAAAITGPFFSRAEAEAQLARRRYAYGPNTVVYSLSGHESADWRAFCHEPPGVQDATARAEAAEQRAAAAEARVERMLAEVRKVAERCDRDAANARKHRLEWSDAAGCEAQMARSLLASLERAAKAEAQPAEVADV